MDNNEDSNQKLSDEFRNLGKNIFSLFKTALESPERYRIQQDLENGLNEITNSIKEEVDQFSTSSTGQQLKSDVADIKERVRSGELEGKIRNDLTQALHTANNELQRVVEQFTSRPQPAEKEDSATNTSGETPPSPG